MIKLNNRQKMKELFVEQPYFVAAGIFYGFPECCVEGFATSWNMDSREAYPDVPSNGSGYIPCVCCAPNVLQDWEGFQKNVITKNRHSSLPFPQDDNDKQLHRFFHKLAILLEEDPLELALQLRSNTQLVKTIKEENKLLSGKLQVNNIFKKYIATETKITTEKLFDFCSSNEKILDYLYKPTLTLLNKALKNKKDTHISHEVFSMENLVCSLNDQLQVVMTLNDNDIHKKKIEQIIPQLADKLYMTLQLEFINVIKKRNEIEDSKVTSKKLKA